MSEQEIAEKLSAEERDFMRFWRPGGIESAEAHNYPGSPAAERAMMADLERRGLWWTKVERMTVDGETDNYTSHGLTDLGKRVAALVGE